MFIVGGGCIEVQCVVLGDVVFVFWWVVAARTLCCLLRVVLSSGMFVVGGCRHTMRATRTAQHMHAGTMQASSPERHINPQLHKFHVQEMETITVN